MYSQQDLDEAVAAGAIDATAAASLRNFFDGDRATPAVDEEQFRLVTSFNDIFVSIASASCCSRSAGSASRSAKRPGLIVDDDGRDGPSFLAPAAVAATAWGLALFFTAKRRMALPSIILLLAFVGGVFATAGVRRIVAARSARRRSRTMSAARQRARRGRRARSPPAPLGSTGAASTFRSPSPPAPPRSSASSLGAGRRRARRRSTSIEQRHARLRRCCSASACSCSRCAGIRRTRRASRAARTSPSGFTCWPRR